MNNSTENRNILIIVPWLEGGGAQGALVSILERLPKKRLTLVILFDGNRNHSHIETLVSNYQQFDFSRSIVGVYQASRELKGFVDRADTVYSLMRASHLVLGLLSADLLRNKRLAATFHQLPSHDSMGLQGKIENILVRRGICHAELVTAPSDRAVLELIERKFCNREVASVEHNLIKIPARQVTLPRRGRLQEIRLVFAGRLTHQKGLDRMAGLMESLPVPVRVRCLGDGEERQTLIESIKTISSKHTVELIPHVEDITEHIDWADAIFLPSRWELNPLVVWEGWSRGRPTVGSAIQVFQDLSKIGPLWTFEDHNQFAEIIGKLSSDPMQREFAHVSALESFDRLNTRSKIVEYLGR